MNNKILLGSIIAVVMLVLVSSSSVVGLKAISQNSSLLSPHLLQNENLQIERHYKVIGFGNVEGLYVNNVSINLRGYVYADISVINWEAHPPAWGRHFIIYNLEKREFFTAKTLPLYFLIVNFRGYLNSKPFYDPHGPHGCGYGILGSAEDIREI